MLVRWRALCLCVLMKAARLLTRGRFSASLPTVELAVRRYTDAASESGKLGIKHRGKKGDYLLG